MTLNTPAGTQTVTNAKDWRSILQAVLSFLGALWMFGQAILLIFVGITGVGGMGNTQSMLPLALVSIALGLLLIPSGIIALARIKGQSLPAWLDFSSQKKQGLLSLSIAFLPPALILGWLGSKLGLLSTFLVPLFGILGICLPILWLLNFGMHGLKGGSPQRKWGLFGLSLTFTTGLIIFIELLAVTIGLVLFMIWASVNPEISSLLTDISQKIMLAGDNIDAVLRIVEPYIT
ncbi:MAG: hypothetical protein MUO40_09150, partial [Anaerolineaceae bacterium]|nr:hypothetical protein [Anaerolineaceae bacterium]